MRLEDFINEYNALNLLIIESRYKSQELVLLYKEYSLLKENMLSISLIGLTEKKIEELDIIRFTILESLCLLEIDLRKMIGKDLTESYFKLEKLYEKNGGDVKYEK